MERYGVRVGVAVAAPAVAVAVAVALGVGVVCGRVAFEKPGSAWTVIEICV